MEEYANQDLKSRSFKGRNLSGADFSNADIRSCDFSGAMLEGANFKGAIGGLRQKQELILIGVAVFLASVAGFVAALTTGIFFIAFFKSFGYATITIGFVLAAIFTISTSKYGYVALASAVAITIAIAGAGVGNLAGAGTGALIVALILVFGGIGAATGAGIYATIGNASVLIAGCGSLAGAILVAINRDNFIAGIIAMVGALSVEILAGFVAHSALNGNEKLVFIRTRAIAFSAWGGTSFYKADLNRADLSYSRLEKTDLRYASIFQTDFQGVIGSEYARLEGTILGNPFVRELCVTRNGRGKDYTDTKLDGAYLKEARLERSTLVRTQILGADFTDASLTGACIQGLNFNGETLFDNVDCQRIFLKCDAKGSFYEPKPDNGSFEAGQFSKWIQEVKDTVDLIFDKGLNWKAFAFSLAQSAIDNKEGNLSLRSIENKGDGVVVAKVQVPEGVNKANIHQSLTENYQEAVQKLETNDKLIIKLQTDQIDTLKQLLESSNNHIGSLIASMSREISISGEGNKLYFVNNKGTIMSSDYSNQSRNINAGGDFNLEQTGSTFNIGDISGAVTNTVKQLQESDQPDAPKLADLISQLQVAIEREPTLTEEQKKDALEALETIGEEAQKSPESRVQKLCKFALNNLKALVPIATITGELSNLLKDCLPQIVHLLGL